jgi:hypothetical protein
MFEEWRNLRSQHVGNAFICQADESSARRLSRYVQPEVARLLISCGMVDSNIGLA